MNIENMKKLIMALEDEKNPVGFNMTTWFSHNGKELESLSRVYVLDIVENHSCGTAACIAGHAALLAWAENEGSVNVLHTARNWLGLDRAEARSLFHGNWIAKTLSNISKDEAIGYLHFLVHKANFVKL